MNFFSIFDVVIELFFLFNLAPELLEIGSINCIIWFLTTKAIPSLSYYFQKDDVVNLMANALNFFPLKTSLAKEKYMSQFGPFVLLFQIEDMCRSTKSSAVPVIPDSEGCAFSLDKHFNIHRAVRNIWILLGSIRSSKWLWLVLQTNSTNVLIRSQQHILFVITKSINIA